MSEKASRKPAYVGNARIIIAETLEALAQLAHNQVAMTPVQRIAAKEAVAAIRSSGGAAYIERIEREHKGTDQ